MSSVLSVAREMLIGALWFGFLGPPIGCIMFMLLMMVYAAGEVSALLIFSGFFIFVFWSYVFGLIPAIVSGLVLGPFQRQINTWPRFICCGLACALVATIWEFLSDVIFYKRAPSLDNLPLFYAAPAFLAGTVVAWIRVRVRAGRTS